MGEGEKYVSYAIILVEKPEGRRNYLEDIAMYERVTSKWILDKYGGRT
jgi:hypothetical protein